uniref:Uncharacterized protein n=1 Tax=Nelumbo nucifera TaxID=4432 RepID=A0A822ZG94_NELNU|nr:TPA_asm: hypothetical protein HUJ06_000685 [Nelumbo nucifera]
MEVVGYNREAGFVWLKQRTGMQHTFKQVSYANEITAFVENHWMKKLTRVKSKGLLIWITLSDIYVDDPASSKISFKAPAGISRSFLVFAFELEEEANKKEECRTESGAKLVLLPAPNNRCCRH